VCARVNRKPSVQRETGHTQTHDKDNTTHDHAKEHPPHLTTIEGGATTVRTTPHARVGGRAEVSVGGRVEVRRALGRARVRIGRSGSVALHVIEFRFPAVFGLKARSCV